MPDAFVTVLPMILAAVLVASAVAKLRTPDDLAGWAELGVPRSFRREWLLRLHPWGEIALALALVVLGGVFGLLAAAVAVVLMGAYLWLVARAYRQSRAAGQDASCACFGTRRRITGVMVLRNAWLTALAAAVASVIWTTPLLGGAIASVGSDWVWLAAAAVAAVTTALVLWPDGQGAQPIASGPALEAALMPGDDDELDYVRTRTPAVPVTFADGTLVNLRELASRKPMMLLAVSTSCGSCEPVIERLPAWRELLPEVDFRLLFTLEPEHASWTERGETQSLHDPQGYVSGSIADWPTPTAVLLGIDGLLAGGPVSGIAEIEPFIEDVYESLHGVRPEASARR